MKYSFNPWRDIKMRKINYTKHIGFLMNEDMYRKILKVTDKMEIPVSEFIRKVLEDRLNQSEGGPKR